MKRFLVLLIIAVQLVSLCGCGGNLQQSEMEQALTEFVAALKIYDREAMTALLTEFPNNSKYVYYDDIFNDEGYMEMYRLLYTDISYTIVSAENDRLIAEFTMPDVQTLYNNILALVLQMSLDDATLQEKLGENDENGSVLVREMMLAYAQQGYDTEVMTKSVTLTFQKKNGRAVIVCDDELRALMTGNFFLSKSSTIEGINK